jgi:hypothetical protein
MRAFAVRAAMLLGASCALAALSTAPAYAKTSPAEYSSDQVGYAATGANFLSVEINATMPRASQFARYVGRIGLSVQLWSARTVIDLSASACTDATCSPGGSPASRKYRLNLAVYDRKTKALICSTAAASSARRCQGAPASWNRYRLAAGQVESLWLEYDTTAGWIAVDGTGISAVIRQPGLGTMRQARIAAEFGQTPFAATSYRHPQTKLLLMKLGVPPGPPYEAEFQLANTRTYCMGAWKGQHKLDLTRNGAAGHREASQTATSYYGCNFSVYLEP